MSRRAVGLVMGVGLLAAWIALGTVGFMIIEGWVFVDSLYMTVITISTVGFREVHELSTEGRLFASFIIVAGLATAVYTFTRLGQLVLEGELVDILGRRHMESGLNRLNGHVIVCGFGRMGKPVAEGMRKDKLPFSVIDRGHEAEEDLRSHGYPYVIGDATDEDVLRHAGIERAATLLALLPSDADNLYLTMTAKSLKSDIRVIARGTDERAEVKLKRGGADRVVSPYPMAAARVLNAAVKPMLVEFMELVTHRQYLPLRLEEIPVSDRSRLAGHSLADAEIRQRYKVIVVAVKKTTGEMDFNPEPNHPIVAGDVLIAMGKERDLVALEDACAG